MRQRATSFWEAFRPSLIISTLFSVPGAIFFVPGKQFVVLTAIVSAITFATVISAGQIWLIPRLRFPSFLLTIAAMALAYMLMLVVSMLAMLTLSISISDRAMPWSAHTVGVVTFILGQRYMPWAMFLGFAMMVGITFLVMISQKLGPGVMMNWMVGRYYNPRQEERIFMFLDMKDSTTLAEQLGDMKFSALVREFLNDLSYPVTKTKGEVSHYIGDEAVLCWKLDRGLKDARCLEIFFLMQDVLESRRAFYEKQFGFVPSFKAGAHVGSVVATQVGEIKSEIVFHGDVLNTAARIQGLCNSLGDDFLISKELSDLIGPEHHYVIEPCGSHELKGKAQPVELRSVTRR